MKVFVYIMGKEEDHNSRVRAIEVMMLPTNTMREVVEFLNDASRLRHTNVEVTLKLNGSALMESLTIKDIVSMCEEEGKDELELFIYNVSPDFNNTSSVKADTRMGSIFQQIDENPDGPEALQDIPLDSSASSLPRKYNSLEFKNENLGTETMMEMSPFIRSSPSKKEQKRQMKKDECCLLL